MYGIIGVPPVLWVIRGQTGTQSWVPRLNVYKLWVRKFGNAASESSTLWDATGPVSM